MKSVYGIVVYVPEGFDKYEAERTIVGFFDGMKDGLDDSDSVRVTVHEGIEPKIIASGLPRSADTQFEKWFYQKFTRKEMEV